jgi:hypothetical protein
MRARMLGWWLLFGASVLAGSSACSGTSPTQACTDLTTAVCAELQQCAPPLLAGAYGDSATCISRTSIACENGLALKNTSDTADEAEKCSKAYASLSCNDFLDNNPPAACTHTTPGKIADGSACGTAGQCVSGVCQINGQTGCGTCIEPVAAMQPCKETSDCQSGLLCALSSQTAAVCIAPVASGATCSNTAPIIPCQSGLLCNMGKCQAPLPANAACTPAAPLCDAQNGFWCTPVGTRCVPILYAAMGQPCGYDKTTGDLTACSGSGFCGNVSMSTGLGTCTAPAADGAACDTANGPLCLPPAFCDITSGVDGGTAGTCTLVNPSTCN